MKLAGCGFQNALEEMRLLIIWYMPLKKRCIRLEVLNFNSTEPSRPGASAVDNAICEKEDEKKEKKGEGATATSFFVAKS